MDAAGVSYVFGVNQNGELQTLYWGKRLRPADAFPEARANEGSSAFDLPVNATPQEFTGWGGGLVVVPDLKVTFPDGNRDLVLHYVSHAIRGNVLTITLKDISRDVFVDLQYEMNAETGILARSVGVENRTHEPFAIEQAFAATWNLPAASEYQLRYLTGRWAGEWNLQQTALHPGKVVLESRRGSTGDEVNPWFAIERGSQPDQDVGDVWFGALAWSGSWQINVETDWANRPRITGGYILHLISRTYLRLDSRCRRQNSTVVIRTRGLVGPRVCCIGSNWIPLCPRRRIAACGRCFTTRGRRRVST